MSPFSSTFVAWCAWASLAAVAVTATPTLERDKKGITRREEDKSSSLSAGAATHDKKKVRREDAKHGAQFVHGANHRAARKENARHRSMSAIDSVHSARDRKRLAREEMKIWRVAANGATLQTTASQAVVTTAAPQAVAQPSTTGGDASTTGGIGTETTPLAFGAADDSVDDAESSDMVSALFAVFMLGGLLATIAYVSNMLMAGGGASSAQQRSRLPARNVHVKNESDLEGTDDDDDGRGAQNRSPAHKNKPSDQHFGDPQNSDDDDHSQQPARPRDSRDRQITPRDKLMAPSNTERGAGTSGENRMAKSRTDVDGGASSPLPGVPPPKHKSRYSHAARLSVDDQRLRAQTDANPP